MNAGIDAAFILSRLEERHTEDVFIPECKTGATGGIGDCFRMDAWVMKKSWAKPRYIAYEIKVSRSDFLRDTKWTEYLRHCTEFYFACPVGLISLNELPPEAGLVYINESGVVRAKKAAPKRDTGHPADVMRYAMMWRADIRRYDDIARRRINKAAGQQAARIIRRAERRVQLLERENKRLARYYEAINSGALAKGITRYAEIEELMKSISEGRFDIRRGML